jgi:hypothetical protein
MRILFSLLLLSINGCKSTVNTQFKICASSINFSIDEKVPKKDEYDLAKFEKQITKTYSFSQGKPNFIDLTLIKAYVRPGMYILKATAVLRSLNHNTNEVQYFRSSNIDANIASLDGEYQYVLEQAVFMAINKAIATIETCVNT